MNKLILAAAMAAALSLGACNNGSAERAGENIDSAVENATQGHENAGNGPMENAGEAIDRAGGTERQGNVADDIEDATDGNPRTNP